MKQPNSQSQENKSTAAAVSEPIGQRGVAQSLDISLANLIKEKEICDKGCKKQIIYQDNNNRKYYCGFDCANPENGKVLCLKCQATSLALSKGIEVATKQKRMSEILVENIISMFNVHSDNCNRTMSKNDCSRFRRDLNKLAEQLEVKDE